MNHVRCFRGSLCICVRFKEGVRTSWVLWVELVAITEERHQGSSVELMTVKRKFVGGKEAAVVVCVRSLHEKLQRICVVVGVGEYYDVGAENFCRIDSLTCFRVLFQHSRRRDNSLGFVMIRPVVLKHRSFAESWQLTTSSFVVLTFRNILLYILQAT